MVMNAAQLKNFLDAEAARYEDKAFIADDPISVPHLFTRKQDIEISGFIAAVLAWGLRKTIIAKCRELMTLMDNAPFDFVVHHTEKDLLPLRHFKHRTFNTTDLMYFIEWMQWYYARENSLENAFSSFITPADTHVGPALTGFHDLFFSLPEAPHRTKKHIPTPARGSSCKRLNMFLRWMVRSNKKGVDFGLWKKILPAQLLCPIDLHVERTAKKLGLIERVKADWTGALQLTEKLREFNPDDPVKYDFALFGMGVNDKAAS
jgi:uncharacterized protein (TIGR02757 family)